LLGLEYILGLYNMQHVELAEKLGIKKQNINLWIKGRQSCIFRTHTDTVFENIRTVISELSGQ
jgi:DNA-binding XRE family transcriptional regulator